MSKVPVNAQISQTREEIAALQAQVAALQSAVATLQTSNSALQSQLASVQRSNVFALNSFVSIDPNPENGVITFKGAGDYIR
jgi:prefoldin subunit 5